LPIEVKDQIAKYHNAEYGHLGLLKTMKAMRAHDIHLHDMTNAVAAYIKACDTCQKTRSSRPFVPAYATLQETTPFRSIHLDHIVNLPESTEGFLHILVMIDAFTGFVMLKACKSLEAKHVVSALAEMFGRFGGPYEIYMDNHPSFLAKDLQAITRLMGTKRRYSHPHSSESHGKVERTNQEVMRLLSALR